MESNSTYTAFDGRTMIAHGALGEVALHVKKHLKAHPAASVLVFSDLTGKQMDFDLRGSDKEVLGKLQIYLGGNDDAKTPAGPGRPKLGVVAREISLLPRHWEWLSTQSGGASGAIRRLIDEARKSAGGREAAKRAQERTHKFMSSLAGDLPRFEEALRALYKKDKSAFKAQTAGWPVDVKEYLKKLSAEVFET